MTPQYPETISSRQQNIITLSPVLQWSFNLKYNYTVSSLAIVIQFKRAFHWERNINTTQKEVLNSWQVLLKTAYYTTYADSSVTTATSYRLDNSNRILNGTQISLFATTTKPRGHHPTYPSYIPGDKVNRILSSTFASSYDREFAQPSERLKTSGMGGCIDWWWTTYVYGIQ